MQTLVEPTVHRAPSDDASRAMDGLRKVVRALRSGNAQAERALGISSAQLFALRAIAAQPGGSLGDVAERTLTSQSSVSEVVSRLVERGLITRVASARDRRRLELTVSNEGQRLLARAPATVQEKLAAGLLSLPAEQRQAIAEGFDAWMNAAGLSTVPALMFFEDSRA